MKLNHEEIFLRAKGYVDTAWDTVRSGALSGGYGPDLCHE